MSQSRALNWKPGGVLLGVVFFLAVLLVKPIGVSGVFAIVDGLLWSAVDASLIAETPSGVTSTNAYLAKSGGQLAKSVANPWSYLLFFVTAMALGGLLSSRARGGIQRNERRLPALWRANFGDRPRRGYAFAFLGGFTVLFGARLAGACTSGHMMSGMMQTSLSGYLFAAGAFSTAIPIAIALYRKAEPNGALTE